MGKNGNAVLRALGLQDIGARFAARRQRRQALNYQRAAARDGLTASRMPDAWPHGQPAHHRSGPTGPIGPPVSDPRVVSRMPTQVRVPGTDIEGPRSPGRACRPPGIGGTLPGGGRAVEVTPRSGQLFDVLAVPRRESWWVRLRRAVTVVVLALVLVAGTTSIVSEVWTWVAPTASPARAASADDTDLTAVAEPFAVDYLSWSDRESRQTALARSAAPDTDVDGWGGTGRQWADSPTTLGIIRSNEPRRGRGPDGTSTVSDGAVVTVRVRVIPFTAEKTAGTPPSVPSPSPGRSPGDVPAPKADSSRGAPNAASGPIPGEPGWAAGRPRWVNLAVPVGLSNGRVVVTAMPALVGTPQTSAHKPAVPQDSTSEDGEFAQDTRDTVATLLRAYASGDLQYARAPGTSFRGLDNAVELADIVTWRTQTQNSADESGGEGERVRVGDVTVTWVLSGDAGTLRCTYRVELRTDGTHGINGDSGAGGRWYLASIGVPTEAVT